MKTFNEFNELDLQQKLNQKRIYKAKYLAPTNYEGSRIKIKDLYTNKVITYPYNYKYNNIEDMAVNIIENELTYLKVTEAFCDNNELYLIAKNY
jgi:hypothetical protein